MSYELAKKVRKQSARSGPVVRGGATPEGVLSLQQQIGNEAVTALLGRSGPDVRAHNYHALEAPTRGQHAPVTGASDRRGGVLGSHEDFGGTVLAPELAQVAQPQNVGPSTATRPPAALNRTHEAEGTTAANTVTTAAGDPFAAREQAPAQSVQPQTAAPRSVAEMSLVERLNRSITSAGRHLGPEVVAQLKQLLSPEGLEIMEAFLAAQFLGFGEIADAIGFGLLIYKIKKDAVEVAADLKDFMSLTYSPTTVEDLDKAGEHLAHAITLASADTVMFLLMGKGEGEGKTLAEPEPAMPLSEPVAPKAPTVPKAGSASVKPVEQEPPVQSTGSVKPSEPIPATPAAAPPATIGHPEPAAAPRQIRGPGSATPAPSAGHGVEATPELALETPLQSLGYDEPSTVGSGVAKFGDKLETTAHPRARPGKVEPLKGIERTRRAATRKVKSATTREEQLYGIPDRGAMRRSTPTPALREMVKVELGPNDMDPAYPELNMDSVQADHIVSMNVLRQLPGFAMLDEAAQLEILNMRENLAPMSQRVNSSRGDRSWREWKGWNGRAPEPNFLATMIAEEQRLLALAQQRIEVALRTQMKTAR